MNYKFLFPIVCLTLLNSCNNPIKPSNSDSTENTEAVQVKDSANADLWAYLYSHEFVSDTFSLTFYGDKAYINDERMVDALVVSENEESVATLVGVSPRNGRTIRLAVIRDEKNRTVVDMTDKENAVFYFEKEVE